MSNVKIGSSYDGTNKGKIQFKGKIVAETDSSCNYDIGGKVKGLVDDIGSVVFDETIKTSVAKQENVDNNEIPEPSRSQPKLENYQMESDEMPDLPFQIKGHMTMFNQEFRNKPNFREGSANDVETLKVTFNRLGVEPVIQKDLKLTGIVKEVDALSKTDFSTYKLFVCVYMSHGTKKGYVSAADQEFNLKDTIFDPILRNKSLRGIPKIFVTVACRGDSNYYECDGEEFDGHILSEANDIDYSNCIISYSTYEGHVSKRTVNGTYFIQNLCKNINKDTNGNTKIHSIFAEVNGKLAEMYKQVPVFKTTMGDICFRDLASA